MVVVVKEMYQCLMSEMEKGMATHSSILAWRIPWTEGWATVHRVTKSQTQLKQLSTYNI